MNPKQALGSLLQVFSVFAFFAAGLFFAFLPQAPAMRYLLAERLINQPNHCTWAGFCFFGLGTLFLLGFYVSARGRYLVIKMGSNSARINARVLKKAIRTLFAKQFAARVRLTDVAVNKERSLELGVSLDTLNEEEREKLLADAELHLTAFLADRFGYSNPFVIRLRS